MRLADGVVLVVDAVEGVMIGTERSIRAACVANLPITLVVNKVSGSSHLHMLVKENDN